MKVLNISYFYPSKLLSSLHRVCQFGRAKYCLYIEHKGTYAKLVRKQPVFS